MNTAAAGCSNGAAQPLLVGVAYASELMKLIVANFSLNISNSGFVFITAPIVTGRDITAHLVAALDPPRLLKSCSALGNTLRYFVAASPPINSSGS
ncbi:MAG: hypothetical protein H6645_05435 [Caldilineaceae bacterium]|nr:hypothetical protein [Caldilineaceae bacterium]